MKNRISQREARRLRVRVAHLEDLIKRQYCSWSSDFPGGTNIAQMVPSAETIACVKTARRLGHAVVVLNVDSKLLFYALPLPRSP